MNLNAAEFAATDLLKQMTADMAMASGQKFHVGDFEHLGDGIAATVITPTGVRFRVSVECLGEPGLPLVS